MLNKKVGEALNAQINAEFWSAYLYLSMSAYFEAEGKIGSEFNSKKNRHTLKYL